MLKNDFAVRWIYLKQNLEKLTIIELCFDTKSIFSVYNYYRHDRTSNTNAVEIC